MNMNEDSWKVNPKLTLDLGVRYDVQLTPAPGLVNNNYPPISTQYSKTIKNVLNRVQPRVGFSWNPNVGTIVRGGYGIFSGLNQGSTYYAMRVENGVVQINYNYSGCRSLTGSAKGSLDTVARISVPSVIIGRGYTVATLSSVPCLVIPCQCVHGEFTLEVCIKVQRAAA